MAHDAPRFRPDRGTVERGAPWSLVLLLGVVTVLLVLRGLWEPGNTAPVLVEVVGEVPNPGLWPLEEGTVHEAVRAAGGNPGGLPDGPVPPGYRLVVESGGVRMERPGDPVLVSLPVDPNTAEKLELMAIPGIGEALATRIVADRGEHGPFRGLEDLRRVPGVRPETLNAIEPFVELSAVPALDLNRATAGELEALPGIGPVLAARIVVDRAEGGPYGALEELGRVSGVGPALIERITPLVEVRP